MNISRSIYKRVIALIVCSTFLLFSCVREPISPEESNASSESGIYVVCEGLWHYDNSVLSKIDPLSGSVTLDYFKQVNNYKLGDLANSATAHNGYIYIVLTTPAIIEKIDYKTGRSVARLKLPAESDPRHICIVNDTSAFVTSLMNNCVYSFNPDKMTQNEAVIKVGPAPEQICSDGQYLYVANSGFGDYLANKPGAGTISVIDMKNMREVSKIACGPNTVEVKYNPLTKRIYATYKHLPSMKDSLGGIVEYSTPAMKEQRRFRVSANALTISSDGYDLYYNTDDGVNKIDLMDNAFAPKLIIANPNKAEKWYSIAQIKTKLYIGNAKNYQMNGEVLEYQLPNIKFPKAKYTVGINPNTIIGG